MIRRARPTFLALIATLLVSGCGGGSSGEDAATTSPNADADAPTTQVEPGSIEPGSTEAAQERLGAGATAFARTPELDECMERAGFTFRAPPEGAIAAWTHGDGSALYVASDSGAALQLAGTVGTSQAPANVDSSTVTTGPSAPAAAACLER
jgi:hypothetical protein